MPKPEYRNSLPAEAVRTDSVSTHNPETLVITGLDGPLITV